MKKQIKKERRDFPGSPAVNTLSSQCRGAWVQSLVRELDSIVPRLKIPCASTKTRWSQIKKFKGERAIGGPGSKREVKNLMMTCYLKCPEGPVDWGYRMGALREQQEGGPRRTLSKKKKNATDRTPDALKRDSYFWWKVLELIRNRYKSLITFNTLQWNQ